MKNEISKEEEDEPDKRDFAEVEIDRVVISRVSVELLRNRDHLHK